MLTVVGDVQPADVRRLVEKHFGLLARAPRSGEVRVVEPPQRVEKQVTLHYAGDRQYATSSTVRRLPTSVTTRRSSCSIDCSRRGFVTLSPAVDVTTIHTATPYPFVYRISISAGAQSDVEKLLATAEDEIARLRAEDVSAAELAEARMEAAPSRGGRGRGGAQTQQGGVPPRQSNLTQIANDLTSRESFAWEVSAETRQRIQRDQANVSSADIKAYADRWLRPTQRTVGRLLPGPDDFMPQWSNGRVLAGDRLEVPPLTTPPAPRKRPTPVPARALEPLAPLGVHESRALLDNGVVVRIAESAIAPAATVAVRVTFGSAATGDGASVALLGARWIAADSGLRALGARLTITPLANDGYFDILVSAPESEASGVITAIALALRSRPTVGARFDSLRTIISERWWTRPRRRGAGGSAVAADARAKVLAAVAPAWQVGDPSDAELSRVSAADVASFLDRHLLGGAVTIGVVARVPSAVVSVGVQQTLNTLPKGDRVSGKPSPVVSLSAHSDRDNDRRIALATETQVTVLAGLPGVPRASSDWRALELLNYIAGVPSYGGRLGWALTKAGLTYSSAATTTFGATTGHILFSTKCDTRNLDATVQAIREVIAGIAEHGVEQWEVDEAKGFTLGRMLLYGARDDSGGDALASALLDSETFGIDLLDLPSWSRGYLAVTRDVINAVARKYYRPDRLVVVSIGAIPLGAHASPFKPGTFAALFDR